MSISFDRAAEYYDATRGYPLGVADQIGQALLKAAGATPQSRILEMGVGTGRIALPIIRAGYTYTGIDLSPRMLEKLRAALPTIPGASERVTLLEGDVTALPFADGSFDAVITVHVFHLVSDRVRAIEEEVRVLARPGVALNGRDEFPGDESNAIGAQWREILRGLGWTLPERKDADESHSVAAEWRRLGAEVDRFVAQEGEMPWSRSREIEWFEQRLGSATWPIPDDLHAEAARRLRAWATSYYGADLEKTIQIPRQFVIERGRFA